eukprot:15452755-Alexandrium_andersonii.AAC.1
MGDFGIAKVLDCTLAVARTQIGVAGSSCAETELCHHACIDEASAIALFGHRRVFVWVRGIECL